MCEDCKEKDNRIKELEDIIYNAMYEEELEINKEKAEVTLPP